MCTILVVDDDADTCCNMAERPCYFDTTHKA